MDIRDKQFRDNAQRIRQRWGYLAERVENDKVLGVVMLDLVHQAFPEGASIDPGTRHSLRTLTLYLEMVLGLLETGQVSYIELCERIGDLVFKTGQLANRVQASA